MQVNWLDLGTWYWHPWGRIWLLLGRLRIEGTWLGTCGRVLAMGLFFSQSRGNDSRYRQRRARISFRHQFSSCMTWLLIFCSRILRFGLLGKSIRWEGIVSYFWFMIYWGLVRGQIVQPFSTWFLNEEIFKLKL